MNIVDPYKNPLAEIVEIKQRLIAQGAQQPITLWLSKYKAANLVDYLKDHAPLMLESRNIHGDLVVMGMNLRIRK